MRWILAIDGGGTKTTAWAADMEGNILGRLEKGPANYHVIGLGKFQEVIREIIDDICRAGNLQAEKMQLISLGLAGVRRERDRELISNALVNLGISCPKVVKDDATIALVAGLSKAEGIVLIAGTGSIAYGINHLGVVTRAGGWGHIISDEGSGYDIGRQALVRGIKSAEGRDKPSILLKKITEKLGIVDRNDLIEFVHSPATGKQGVAALSEIVAVAAGENDLVAIEILENAANSLTSLVESVINRGFPVGMIVNVCTYGGVLRNIPYVKQGLTEKLQGKAIVIASDKEPVAGALQIGYEHLKHGKIE
jgi:N-acetylglucosamine kinase-like BadF-type ATPase